MRSSVVLAAVMAAMCVTVWVAGVPVAEASVQLESLAPRESLAGQKLYQERDLASATLAEVHPSSAARLEQPGVLEPELVSEVPSTASRKAVVADPSLQTAPVAMASSERIITLVGNAAADCIGRSFATSSGQTGVIGLERGQIGFSVGGNSAPDHDGVIFTISGYSTAFTATQQNTGGAFVCSFNGYVKVNIRNVLDNPANLDGLMVVSLTGTGQSLASVQECMTSAMVRPITRGGMCQVDAVLGGDLVVMGFLDGLPLTEVYKINEASMEVSFPSSVHSRIAIDTGLEGEEFPESWLSGIRVRTEAGTLAPFEVSVAQAPGKDEKSARLFFSGALVSMYIPEWAGVSRGEWVPASEVQGLDRRFTLSLTDLKLRVL